MRPQTSRGVPEWSGGKDLYMGSLVLVAGKVSRIIGIVLARDSIVGISIPCSISLLASLFYLFRNTSSLDQLLDHIVHIMMMSYRVGPEIPLRHTE